MKKLLIIAFIIVPILSFGQDDNILVIVDVTRKVEVAYRIDMSPKIIDTTIPTILVDYPLLVLKHETESEVEEINPAFIKTIEKLPKLYNAYIKLGIGSELMPLGEIYVNGLRSRKYIYGAHIKHLSSFGNLTGYAPAQFDRTGGNFFGGINERKYSIRGDIHYNNQGFHYYGISDTLALGEDSIKQRYSDFGISGSYSSHIKDIAKVNYKIGLSYNNYQSRKPSEQNRDWRARENYFDITSHTWYKHKKETFAADLNVRYNGYRYGVEDTSLTGLDTGIVLNNTVINLKPYITTFLQDNRFKAKIGLDLVFDIHNQTKVYVYPIAEVKYSMFNDIFIPYVGVRGGLDMNSFRGITQQNEFVLPNLQLRNQQTPIAFYGGIKGTLSRRISFKASIDFAHVRDKALFVTDTLHTMGNAFDVIYDTMNVTTIEASISYQLREKIKVDAIGRYFSYSAYHNSYAWNLPRFQVILRGSYNMFNKLMINLDFNMEEGRKALVYADGEGVKEENGQFYKSLGFVADLNLGLEYRYNKRLSVFLQANNLAAQGYQRWYNAPVQRFQILGGVTFRL
ncbi:MAG: hypothetical protein QNK23_01705 [Crocinitomicaceae bacterium]|nr:hypothetical protein [Crocinitomicaceae bacterium]